MSPLTDPISLAEIGKRVKEWELDPSTPLTPAKLVAKQLYNSLKQSKRTNADLVQLFYEQIQVLSWLETCMPIIQETITIDTVSNACIRGMQDILSFEHTYSGWLARIFGRRRRAVSLLSRRLNREANESVSLMMLSATLSTRRSVLDVQEKVANGIVRWEEMKSLVRSMKGETDPASNEFEESWTKFGY